ncbi:hypothetical protein MKW98_022755 [Papaver atlanticum]|uniref:Uncharacterized protein n=1 Tax=Papaver atlanticum TaxID=357466 RepID=A0AAD4TIB8_9MAGN|nr:hypothetical protein MKW98_022755 [Papaver atlanticum]
MPSKKSCIVEFDGAAKGNPGPAGAGAEYNRDADALANRGVNLKDGEVRVYKDY